MKTFRNERLKITVKLKNGLVTAIKDRAKSAIYPDGRKTLFQKRLDELCGVPKDETGYIEHLKTIGYEEVR